jgi:hypothetical protein
MLMARLMTTYGMRTLDAKKLAALDCADHIPIYPSSQARNLATP